MQHILSMESAVFLMDISITLIDLLYMVTNYLKLQLCSIAQR